MSLLRATVSLLMLSQAFGFAVKPRDEVPDEEKTAPQYIQKFGYPAEIHHVTTEDGYILEMHRIPYSAQSPAAKGKPIALLEHGLLSSSFDWITLGPEKSIGFILADIGYDVWIANDRGNFYSKNHTTLDASQGDFWKFSWHEIGIYDVPAEIDYILELTGQDKVHYIGHSMGTTQVLVLLSEKPEYNEKMKSVNLLAPVATLTYSFNPIRLLVPFLDSLSLVAQLIDLDELLPHTNLIANLEEECKASAQNPEVCENFLFLFLGWDAEINKTALPVMLSHVPAGAATRDAIHYGQVIRDKRFQKYDYGLLGNLKKYGRVVPPLYDLSKISAPVALHYGQMDGFADPEDVYWLADHLPNLIGKFRVPFDTFSHIDFLAAKDADTLLYPRIVSIMKQYE